ncbi:MAG: MFS transporter [Trueperaceae bacterium]|nr:MFS transporter [Trueperaceae bacterium]
MPADLARRPFYGWSVVGGAMGLQGLQAMLFSQAFGLYVVALTSELGWSAAAIASGYALVQLLGGLMGPVQGWLLERLGARRVAAVGVVVFGTGLVTASQVTTLAAFTAAMAVTGVGVALSGFLTLTSAIVPWFHRRRATALSLMSLGMSIGGLLVPVVAASVVAFGWRPTLAASGVAIAVLGLPLASLLRRDPARYGQELDGGPGGLPDAIHGGARIAERDPARDFTLRQALRTRAFWAIGVGHGSALLVVAAVVVHLVPHLESGVGLSLQAAATVVAALTATTAVAQVVGGAIGDRFPKRRVAQVAMFSHAAALLSLAWVPGWWGVVAFVLLHGWAWGSRGPLMGAMRADYFGATHFASIMGASALIIMGGQLAGPVIAGVLADVFGDYRWGFTALAALAALGSVAFVLATPPKGRAPRG